HEIALCPQPDRPWPVDVATMRAEEVDRSEESIALENVAIEVRKRRNLVDRHIGPRNNGQPQPQLAQPNGLSFDVDAIERALDDLLAGQLRSEFLDHIQRRKKERPRSARGI